MYQPSAWKPGRVLVLTHVAADGSQTHLGVFQEHINHRASGRRFVPWKGTPGDYSAVQELVHGDYWLHTRTPATHEDSPEEIQALRDRFHELLETFDE